jgi:hypothetical protein
MNNIWINFTKQSVLVRIFGNTLYALTQNMKRMRKGILDQDCPVVSLSDRSIFVTHENIFKPYLGNLKLADIDIIYNVLALV